MSYIQEPEKDYSLITFIACMILLASYWLVKYILNTKGIAI